MKRKWQELITGINDFDFKSTYKVERDPKIKLLTLLHLQSGKTLKDVAEIVIADERTVKNWLEVFVCFDYEGLIEKEGRGRKPRIPSNEEELFKEKLDLLQENKKGGRITGLEIQATLVPPELNPGGTSVAAT